MKISENIEALIDALKILPGVGPKTAKRMALNLLSTNKQGAELNSNSINIALDTIRPCQCCGVINDLEICNILCSLTWDEVKDVLKTKGAHSKTTNGKNIPHLLKINIVFKNPNSNIRDVIVKFNYVLNYIEGLNFVPVSTQEVNANDHYSTNINSTSKELSENNKKKNEVENEIENVYNENTITTFNVFKTY